MLRNPFCVEGIQNGDLDIFLAAHPNIVDIGFPDPNDPVVVAWRANHPAYGIHRSQFPIGWDHGRAPEITDQPSE
jgi:hypothetical protein